MADDEYFDSVRRMIESEATRDGGVKKEEIVWAVLEAVASVIDGGTGMAIASPVVGGLETLRSGIQAQGERKGVDTTPNPWFILNGHDEGGTAATQRYLRNRTFKSIGSGAIGVVTAAASASTAVDVGGIAQSVNALGSTGAHIYKLHAIAKSYKQSRTISGWINLVIKMKAIKTGIRGTQLAGAAIPFPAAGAIAGVVAAGVKLGVKFTMTKVCLMLSADLHWRAFQEQVIAGAFGGKGKVGPASRIIYELFRRRGATRVFGQYDVDQFIKEPCGWMAVSDKVLLM